MTITDLRETAALAHLSMTDSELKGVFPAFEQMLSFFSAMDDSGIDAAGALSGALNSARIVGADQFRPDAVPAGKRAETDLVANAGDRDGPFILIPNVL
jgi:Asp-tRNA(Asn)/Glu-tRNA(Gln) amidotransferase C subunit